MDRNGAVAYKLVEAKIHLIFHVSQLKLHVGPMVNCTQLTSLNADEVLNKKPIAILNRRLGKLNGKVVTEVLIQWKNIFSKDAT